VWNRQGVRCGALGVLPATSEVRSALCDRETHQGPHAIGNLKPLCKFHHILKTHAGWQLVGCDEGAWDLVPPGGAGDRSPLAADDRAPPDELPFAS
jgi:hypothetical protein